MACIHLNSFSQLWFSVPIQFLFLHTYQKDMHDHIAVVESYPYECYYGNNNAGTNNNKSYLVFLLWWIVIWEYLRIL